MSVRAVGGYIRKVGSQQSLAFKKDAEFFTDMSLAVGRGHVGVVQEGGARGRPGSPTLGQILSIFPLSKGCLMLHQS
jgi:hypothetical protein